MYVSEQLRSSFDFIFHIVDFIFHIVAGQKARSLALSREL